MDDQTLIALWAALARTPDDVPTLNALGNALVNARRPEEAIPLFFHALEQAPEEARLHSNLGLAFQESGQFAQAEAAFQTALQLDAQAPAAYNNLGCLYIMMCRHRAALGVLQKALALDPRHVQARRNCALAHLSLGEFERGWEDYDWCAYGVAQPADPLPRWEGGGGQALAGKRILLTARQGLGDMLHFIRYAKRLKALGARVILECPMPLLRVLGGVEGVDEIVAQDGPVPAADLCVPLMALARVFRTTVATIPAEVPYVFAEGARVEAWRGRLGARGAGELRVGICWQGNPHHQWDRFRSVKLERFASLARIAGVRLVSLQRGPGVEQIEAFQQMTGNALRVPTDGRQETPEDLADSAALMCLMDRVITIDSATAHLAGALGRPTWVPLSLTADWRWLTQRPDTPWYPTMRLFRQQVAGDWEGVFAAMEAQLTTEARSGHSAAHAGA